MLRCSSDVNLRAFAATLGFVFTLIFAVPGQAQIPAPPPVFPAIDGNGVDVATGAFTYSQTDVVIGRPGAGGLSLTRY